MRSTVPFWTRRISNLMGGFLPFSVRSTSATRVGLQESVAQSQGRVRDTGTIMSIFVPLCKDDMAISTGSRWFAPDGGASCGRIHSAAAPVAKTAILILAFGRLRAPVLGSRLRGLESRLQPAALPLCRALWTCSTASEFGAPHRLKAGLVRLQRRPYSGVRVPVRRNVHPPETEGYCVVATRGGELPEVNNPSVTT